MKTAIIVSILTSVILASTAFAINATNAWRVAENDQRYVLQSVSAVAELNRLEEKIAFLRYQIRREKDPETKGYLKSLLETTQRNLNRLKELK